MGDNFPRLVLIADESELFREGLKRILEAEGAFNVIGTAADGRDAIVQARRLRPELLIIDAALPLLNGIEVARQITRTDSRIKIIGMAQYADDRIVHRMRQAGAQGFLPKNCSVRELILAAQIVLKGEIQISPAPSREYLTSMDKQSSGVDSLNDLTAREQEVLRLLAEGETTRAIAAILSISDKTVESHRKNLMDKLGIHSIAELTKYAIRKGVTPLDL